MDIVTQRQKRNVRVATKRHFAAMSSHQNTPACTHFQGAPSKKRGKSILTSSSGLIFFIKFGDGSSNSFICGENRQLFIACEPGPSAHEHPGATTPAFASTAAEHLP